MNYELFSNRTAWSSNPISSSHFLNWIKSLRFECFFKKNLFFQPKVTSVKCLIYKLQHVVLSAEHQHRSLHHRIRYHFIWCQCFFAESDHHILINLSFVSTFWIGPENYFIVKDKRIDGILGPVLHRLMVSRHEAANCHFVPVTELGGRLKNGSFTGAKKMLIDKTIDFYSRSENVLLPKGEAFLFEISPPVFVESFHLGQYIDQPKAHNVDALGFLEHSQNIVGLILAGLLTTSAFVLLFQWIQHRSNGRANTRINSRITNDDQSSGWERCFLYLRKGLRRIRNFYKSRWAAGGELTKVNLIFIFFLLFTQFLLNMLASNIKTNELILNVE